MSTGVRGGLRFAGVLLCASLTFCTSSSSGTSGGQPPRLREELVVRTRSGRRLVSSNPARVSAYDSRESMVTVAVEACSELVLEGCPDLWSVAALVGREDLADGEVDVAIPEVYPSDQPGTAQVHFDRLDASGGYLPGLTASGGTVHLELRGGRITGRIDTSQGDLAGELEGTYRADCSISTVVPADGGVAVPSPENPWEFPFCQEFLEFLQGL